MKEDNPMTYNDLPEVISITQAAKLVRASKLKFTADKPKDNNDSINKECLEIAKNIMQLPPEKRLAIKILIE
jgi:hypothetical protein